MKRIQVVLAVMHVIPAAADWRETVKHKALHLRAAVLQLGLVFHPIGWNFSIPRCPLAQPFAGLSTLGS